MKKKFGIFIFTKDSPKELLPTLTLIKNYKYNIFLIDDSNKVTNQIINANIAKKFNNVSYLGKKEFDLFLTESKLSLKKYSFLLKQLGDDKWNLGYARNFALLYAKSIGIETVLFMDEDINVSSRKVIADLLKQTKDYVFVGANIAGLLDNSILGHIASDLKIEQETLLSGGFVLFSLRNVKQYFLNIYNEDWIWFYLNLKNSKYLKKKNVYQMLSDPFLNYKNKIFFQEVGEIVVDAIIQVYKSDFVSPLKSERFWKQQIKERYEYLDYLLEVAQHKKRIRYIRILNMVKFYHSNIKAKMFAKLFKNYFKNHSKFIKLYNSL